MRRLFKWGAWGFGVLAVVLALAVIAVLSIANQTVAPLSGKLELEGLSAPVTVTRDVHGIPHIDAANRNDASMALGFTHAQDRLWQMEFLRMTGQGRLSEILGLNEDVQKIDIFLRTLGFTQQVQSSFKVMDRASQEALLAYAAGVNAWMNRDGGVFDTLLPPEFLILGHSPEPWKPEHSLVVLKLMSLQLSMNMNHELNRLALAARGLSGSEITDIIPHHRDDNAPSLPNFRSWYGLKSPPEKTAGGEAGSSILGDTSVWASNNWVLAGSRTKSGKPLLANDPHLAFNAPSLWYLAHMQWEQGSEGPVNVIGATIPSVPAIVLGRNDKVAWGFTNAGADVQDLFVESFKPDDRDSYLTPTGWQNLKKEEVVIKVKGASDLTFTRRISRHGPILPRTYKDHGDVLRDDHAIAVQWTGLSQSDRSYELLARLATAKSVRHYGTIVRGTIAPMQAMVVADDGGSIGLFTFADVPVRRADNLMAGRAPVPGWDEKYDWQGLVPRSELTQIIDPPRGALGTANSRLVEKNEPLITYDWEEPYRHDRVLKTIVNSPNKLGVEDMMAGQMDTFSPALSALRDVLIAQVVTQPRQAAALERIRDWDGRMDAQKVAPLIMAATLRHALNEVYGDDLGPVMHVMDTTPAAALLRTLQQGGARDWCDRKATGLIETCGDVLANAFEKAVSELEKRHGSNMNEWTWGSEHVFTNEHNPFGKVAPLRGIFNIERPSSGGAYTLMRAKMKLSSKDPYRATHGAGYRAIYDFNNLDASRFVISTGQSGNPASSRFDDQTDLWVAGKYLTMTANRDDWSKDALGTWNLTPVGQ